MNKSEEEAEKNILDVVDYRGKRVIFTEKKWKEKSIQHPELTNGKFLKNLKRTIESPQIVWQDYDDPVKKACYYWRHKIDRYIKVVIWIVENPCRVVSAFEVNYIKETKYSNLKQLK